MSITLEGPQTQVSATTRLRIIDCDIHPALRSASDLDPFLAARWRQHLAEYGKGTRGIFAARGNNVASCRRRRGAMLGRRAARRGLTWS